MNHQTFLDMIRLHPKITEEIRKRSQAPVMGVPETALSPRQLYQAFICENVVPVGRVKVVPAGLFITFIE